MLPATRLLSDADFLEETLLDLRAGREHAGGPLVVAQIAGDDPETIVAAARLLSSLVDAVGQRFGSAHILGASLTDESASAELNLGL